MNSFIDTIKNIYNIKELREKIMLTLGLVIIYRLASFITLPAIDGAEVSRILKQIAATSDGSGQGGIMGLLSSFTGGALNRGSVIALGIMPYISASIVVQLMQHAVPYFKKLQRDGESGRKTITQITRWLTIAICVVQGFFYLQTLPSQFLDYGTFNSAYLVDPNSFWFYFPNLIILISGTIFAMWMGEKITDKGIGNGISILIMVGILAGFPTATIQEYNSSNIIQFLIEALLWLGVLLVCIILVTAVRKVPYQNVSRMQKGGRSVREMGARSYIPLKVNAAGVMPIIFAQALMFVPGLLASNDGDASTFQQYMARFQDMFSWQHNMLFFVMIIIFTYLYTAITVPVNQIADDMKRQGNLIPKVKPGEETANYLDDILSKITLPGSIFLAIVAILPAIVYGLDLVGTQNFAIFFGGTSLIIMVGVILDTIQQVNTYLLNHHYDGLLESKLSRSSIS